MINLQNISFEYRKDKKVIDDLSLTISQGESLGLLGHNGAGKTTLFRLILRLIKPQEGVITINSSQKINAISRGFISYMPESGGIYNKLTVRENIIFRARAAMKYDDTFNRRMNNLLEDLKLSDRLNDKAVSLSNGMKKRLLLICALIVDSEILLMDEPTNGIDPESLYIIIQILHEFKKGGGTIVMSSHDLNCVQRICDSVSILQKGKLIYTGKTNSIESLENIYLSEVSKFN